jgi:salicylate hydroxylase
MSVEDGICLAECLDRAKTTDDIPVVLRAFEEIRQPRCKLVQEWSAAQGQRATLPNGPIQEKRDEISRTHKAEAPQSPWDRVHINKNPESIVSPQWNAWLFRHDAFAYVS